MGSPNAVDVRHAEAITKALGALLMEHAAALATARAEALEEAAGAFDKIQGSIGAKRAALIIRAKKGADAPASIPVERVRQVLLAYRNEDDPAQQHIVTVIDQMLGDLGVPLDGGQKEKPPLSTACNSIRGIAVCRLVAGHEGLHLWEMP